jgi:PPOX class probable F420-dependent enzyme
MRSVTEVPDSHQDLLQGQFGTLATIGPDGGPRSTEIWFLFEDGELRLSLNDARAKTRDLRRNPACSLLILDIENPYRYVDIRGRARIEPDDDYALADRVGAKYGSDLRQHDRPGERRVAVTIEPTGVFAVDMSG